MARAIDLEDLKSSYTIEETGDVRKPYRLTGKRGAVYLLVRQRRQGGAVKIGSPLYATAQRTGNISRLAQWQTEWVRDPLPRGIDHQETE